MQERKVCWSESSLKVIERMRQQWTYRDQIYEKFIQGQYEDCDDQTYEHLFRRALCDRKLEIIKFIALKLGLLDREVFDRAVLKASLEIMDAYRGAIGRNEWIELGSQHLKMSDRELVRVICWFFEQNIIFGFDADEIQVVEKLIGLNDPEIYDWLLDNYPNYKTVQENKRYYYPLCEYFSLGYDLTFLSAAVTRYAFNLIPLIINTCPIESLLIDNDASDYHEDEFVKYGLANTDTDLLNILYTSYHEDDTDYENKEERQINLNRMTLSLVSVYKIRDGWYNLIQARPPYIKGFEWSGDQLLNSFLIFLIWMGKQKPKGLYKLLLYQKVYPHVF